MNQAEKARYQEFLEQLGDEKKAAHAYLRWKCVTDLWFLGMEVLGMKKAHHGGRPLIDPSFHHWLADAIVKRGSKLILVPRWHLKTTWVKIWIVQQILANPYIRIGLFSLTLGLVKKEMVSLRRLFLTPTLRKIWEDRIPEPRKGFQGWAKATEEQLTLYRPIREGYAPQENQLEVFGAGSEVTGSHFDIHIYDDILDDETVRSPTAMLTLENWFSHIRAILDPEGIELMIGTPYHYSDLYAKVRREDWFANVFTRSAIENGKPIYRYFTLKKLEEYRKRMGEYIFACQLLCDASPRQDRMFPPPQPTYAVLPDDKYTHYITVDPAATTKVYSDETAIIVTAVNRAGMIYVCEALNFKKSGDEIARIIISLTEKYHPERIGIELGLQEHLQTILKLVLDNHEKASGTHLTLPIIGIKPDPGKGKYERINLTLGSFVRAGRIKIRYDLYNLIGQMDFMTPNYTGKDDLVDACSMQFMIIRQLSYTAWDANQGRLKKGWFAFEDLYEP
ncbi:MAG: hypothetical protein ABIJ86_06710, partial [Spirochaetota bacterium]